MTDREALTDRWGPAARAGDLWAALTDLGEVVLPVECGGCGAAAVALCTGCAGQLLGPARPLTLTAGALPAGAAAWATARYAGEVRRVVVAWKDRGRHDLTGPLAQALAGAVLALLGDVRAGDPGDHRPEGRDHLPSGGAGASGGPAVLLVPVPSRRRSRAGRGADVVLRLALRAAHLVRASGTSVRVLPALRLGRPVADQAGLGRSGRVRNVGGAMRLRAGARRVVTGRPCVVVDDVVTTGATAREAVRALTAAGAVPIGVAVSCATPLHRGLSVAARLH